MVKQLQARAVKVGVVGNREYNPGWSTALDLHSLLTVSEAIARAAIERKESRGGHFREDFPAKDDAKGKCNSVISKAARRVDAAPARAAVPLPPHLKQIIEEQSK